MRDRILIISASFLRSLATGFIGVSLAIYLSKHNFSVERIGIIVSAGLFGATVASLFTTYFADAFGRRRALIFLSLIAAFGGLVFSLSHSYGVLIAASFVGMLNGMGCDRGSLLIIETAILPKTASDFNRTLVFAWYTALQDAGLAIGGLALAMADHISLRTLLIFYSTAFIISGGIYLFLSPSIEVPRERTLRRISRKSRKTIVKISVLFFIDAIAGGFLATALLSYFFHEKFSASATAIGILFFLARLLNALSHFGAAWLARRIGLINTMVFTHIPSSIVLATVVFTPVFFVAAFLFLLREALVEMDVPTRQSYVMAVVEPHERTFASGVTNIVRMCGWAVAPMFAGLFMAKISIITPVLIGALLKIGYDILLYVWFHQTKPPEEINV